MKKSLIISGIIALGVIILAIFIVNSGQLANNQKDKLVVATTIFPLADMVKNIAGENVEVINILPPGGSPHTFELKPSDIVKLQPAKAVFSIGYHLDSWVSDITTTLPEANIVTVDSGIELTKLRFDHEHEEDEEHEEEADEHEEELDPHYWLSIKNSKIIATNIANTLSELDPANKTIYESNLALYLAELDETETEIRQILKTITKRDLIVFHEAWNYFADEYSLNITAVFAPSAGKEPSPQYLKELYDVTKKLGVKAIFTEPQLSVETIKPFVQDLGLTIYTLDPIGGIDERSSHVANLIYNAKQINQALGQ
jgi:zinc transport system substrate-binding protein